MINLNHYRRSWLTFVFSLLVFVFLVDSFSLSKAAGRIPQATLITTLLILVTQLLVEFRSGLPDQKQNDESKIPSERGVIPHRGGKVPALVILRIGTLVPLIWLFGMSVGTALFCLVYLRWHGEETWKFSIIFSFFLGFILHIGFTWFLHIALYPGAIARVLA